MEAIHSLSPLDGRYLNQCLALRNYFSEAAFIRYRMKMEVEYFIALLDLPLPAVYASLPRPDEEKLRNLYAPENTKGILRIKEIEKTTNHDVKAIEYYLREQFDAFGYGKWKELIHFGLTSQDVNNTAIPLMISDALQNEMLPRLHGIIARLNVLADQWKALPMLAHTHGQPASPTTLGKEMMVFVERLNKQYIALKQYVFEGKFGGATGNFNAHAIAFPQINWLVFSDRFLSKLGLKRQQFTTQIEQYDQLAALFDLFARVNTIFIDLSRDCWAYISMNYFILKKVEGEVGSSAMPHKVNPIDFENAEGNLGLANALFSFFSAKLPVSRLQRDLTDSTVLRNAGVPFGHSMVAWNGIYKGLSKLEANDAIMLKHLNENTAVLAEAVQSVLRIEGFDNPYELLKQFTRGNKTLTQDEYRNFIESLNLPDEVKKRLINLTPAGYLGVNPLG